MAEWRARIDARRETCPVCRRQIRLTRASRIWNHKRPATDEEPDAWPRACEGTGAMSVERIELLAKAEAKLHERDSDV
jgi:hypothetical protein